MSHKKTVVDRYHRFIIQRSTKGGPWRDIADYTFRDQALADFKYFVQDDDQSVRIIKRTSVDTISYTK